MDRGVSLRTEKGELDWALSVFLATDDMTTNRKREGEGRGGGAKMGGRGNAQKGGGLGPRNLGVSAHSLHPPSTSIAPSIFVIQMSSSSSSAASPHHLQSLCNCTAQLLAQCSSGILAKAYHQAAKSSKAIGRRVEDENADLYSAVILCLFAGVILMLMIRAIKPSETLDDQVNLLLTSMRARCEVDEAERRRAKMREAKRKVQRWLMEAKAKSVRKLSFRPRAISTQCQAKTDSDQPSQQSTTSIARFSLVHLFGNGPKPHQQQQRAVSSYNLNSTGDEGKGGKKEDNNIRNGFCQKRRANSTYLLAPEIVVNGGGGGNGGGGKSGEKENNGRGGRWMN